MRSKALLVIGLLFLFGLAGCSGADDCSTGPCCDNGKWVEENQPCVSGQDAFACTADMCTENHECVAQIKEAWCLIENECVPQNREHSDNACLICNPTANQELWTAVEDGTSCDDGLFCNEGETCQAGLCTGGDARTCTVANETCQEARCDEINDRCVINPINDGMTCDDSLICTENTTCLGGFCQGGNQLDCADVVQEAQCQQAACSEQVEGGCYAEAVNIGGACNDGQRCTQNDICTGDGVCQGSAMDCWAVVAPALGSDQVQCVDAVCDETNGCQAVPKADGTDCDDGMFCTEGEACMGGVCGGGEGRLCEELIPDGAEKCLHVACDESNDICDIAVYDGWCYIDGVCVAEGEENPENTCQWCDPYYCDNCTNDEAEWPDGYQGVYAWAPKSDGEWCEDDGNVCTQDVCEQGVCMHQGRVPFQDYVDANENGQWDAGESWEWFAYDDQGNKVRATEWENDEGESTDHTYNNFYAPCPSDSPTEEGVDENMSCTYNICVDNQCIHPTKPNNHACMDDGNECTEDVCWEGVCVHDSEDLNGNDCTDDGNYCTNDFCNNGICDHQARANNTPCIAGTDVDGNECTSDVCWDGICIYQNVDDGTGCEADGELCTKDLCIAGTCTHPTRPNGTLCGAGSTADILSVEEGHDDDNECTVSICQEGVCTLDNPEQAGVVCLDDDNPCSANVCDGAGTCTHPPVADGTACNMLGGNHDGTVCTSEQCIAGQCVFQNSPAGTVCAADAATTDLCTHGSECHQGTCYFIDADDCQGVADYDGDNDVDADDRCQEDVGGNNFCVNGACIDLGAASNDCGTVKDDANLCTKLMCDGAGACTQQADVTMEGDPCAEDFGGDPEDALFADNNVCTAHVCNGMVCEAQNVPVGNNCQKNVDEGVMQDDENNCTIPACDADGQCGWVAGNNGAVCSASDHDNTICTVDTCLNGACVQEPVDDGMDCYSEVIGHDDNACEDKDGVDFECWNTHCWEVVAAACAPACGGGQVCINGACVTPTTDCGTLADDETLCTKAECVAGVCSNVADRHRLNKVCDGEELDDTVCTEQYCRLTPTGDAPAACVAENVPDNLNCGRAYCPGGGCAGGQICIEGACVAQADDGSRTDCPTGVPGDPAEVWVAFNNGCYNTVYDPQEGDNNPCTDDICQAGACGHVNVADGTLLTNSTEWAIDDECVDTICTNGEIDSTPKAEGTACTAPDDHEDLCLMVVGGECNANGECVASEVVRNDCAWESFEDKCHDYTCNPDTGNCEPGPEVECAQTNACETWTCVDTIGCVVTDEVDCDDCDECTDQECQDIAGVATCVYTPNWHGTADGTTCTPECGADEVCINSQCVGIGTGGKCDDGDACTVDTCNEADPAALANGCVNEALDFDDDDVCTADVCDKIAGVTHTFDPNACECDPDATAGDTYHVDTACVDYHPDGTARTCTVDACTQYNMSDDAEVLPDDLDDADDPYLCEDLKERTIQQDAEGDGLDADVAPNAALSAGWDTTDGALEYTLDTATDITLTDLIVSHEFDERIVLNGGCTGGELTITADFEDEHGNVDIQLWQYNGVAWTQVQHSESWTDDEYIQDEATAVGDGADDLYGVRVFMPVEGDCNPPCDHTAGANGDWCFQGECVPGAALAGAAPDGCAGACGADEFCYDDPWDNDGDAQCFVEDAYENLCNTYSITIAWDDTNCAAETSCENGEDDDANNLTDIRDRACNEDVSPFAYHDPDIAPDAGNNDRYNHGDFQCDQGGGTYGCAGGDYTDVASYLADSDDYCNAGGVCADTDVNCQCGEGYGCDTNSGANGDGQCKLDVRNNYGACCAAGSVCVDDATPVEGCMVLANNTTNCAGGCTVGLEDDPADIVAAAGAAGDACVVTAAGPTYACRDLENVAGGLGCYPAAGEFCEATGTNVQDAAGNADDATATVNAQDCGCTDDGLVCVANNCVVNYDWDDNIAHASEIMIDRTYTDLYIYVTAGIIDDPGGDGGDLPWIGYQRDVDTYELTLCAGEDYNVAKDTDDDVTIEVVQEIVCACAGGEFCQDDGTCGTIGTDADTQYDCFQCPAAYPLCLDTGTGGVSECRAEDAAEVVVETLGTGDDDADLTNVDGGTYYLRVASAETGNFNHTTYGISVTSNLDDAREVGTTGENDTIELATDMVEADYWDTLLAYGDGASPSLTNNPLEAVNHSVDAANDAPDNADEDFFAMDVCPEGQLDIFLRYDNTEGDVEAQLVDDTGAVLVDKASADWDAQGVKSATDNWISLYWRVPADWAADEQVFLEVYNDGAACGSVSYFYEVIFDSSTCRELADEGDICEDGIDNDNDTFVDCADPGCSGHTAVDPDAEDCGLESDDPDPALCTDTVDNDGDNLIDCMDDGCDDRFDVGDSNEFSIEDSGPLPGGFEGAMPDDGGADFEVLATDYEDQWDAMELAEETDWFEGLVVRNPVGLGVAAVEDWFFYDLCAGETITITVDGADAGADIDIALYDSQDIDPGAGVVEGPDQQVAFALGTTPDETITYTAQETERHWVKIWIPDSADGQCSTYDLSITTELDDSFDVDPYDNDNKQSAITEADGLTVGALMEDLRHVGNDHDWYRVDACNGSRIRLTVWWEEHVDNDTDLELYVTDCNDTTDGTREFFPFYPGELNSDADISVAGQNWEAVEFDTTRYTADGFEGLLFLRVGADCDAVNDPFADSAVAHTGGGNYFDTVGAYNPDACDACLVIPYDMLIEVDDSDCL